jgi:hypothetical protein
MGEMGMRIQFGVPGRPYLKRCDLCHRQSKVLYQIKFEEDGLSYLLHPLNCVAIARKNYTEKRSKGIHPIGKQSPVDMPEEISISNDDNIDQ